MWHKLVLDQSRLHGLRVQTAEALQVLIKFSAVYSHLLAQRLNGEIASLFEYILALLCICLHQ